jgi:hypothetical protein
MQQQQKKKQQRQRKEKQQKLRAAPHSAISTGSMSIGQRDAQVMRSKLSMRGAMEVRTFCCSTKDVVEHKASLNVAGSRKSKSSRKYSGGTTVRAGGLVAADPPSSRRPKLMSRVVDGSRAPTPPVAAFAWSPRARHKGAGTHTIHTHTQLK